MGAGQSSGMSSTAISNASASGEEPKLKRKPPEHLTGPQLVEWKCRRKKKAWSQCVGGFYSRFSTGKVLEDEEPDCDELFDLYKQCYIRGMLKERERKGLTPPKEGTLLADYAEEEGIEVPKNQQRWS